MIKKFIPCIVEYKKYAILAPLTVALEVCFEVFIPFLMAKIIDIGIANSDINYVLKIGALMIVMAITSLFLGALSGKFAATSATGFAKNVRKKLFYKIQDFSFANIDKYNTATLMARLTSDVTNAQLSFMMVNRVLVRAPFMLISATFMAFSINPDLAKVFFVAIPVLGIGLAAMMGLAFPRFQKMLKKYDEMNAYVQENLIAIRVVKAFVRGDFENKKFALSADELQKAQIKAEKIVVFAMPLMMFTLYACMIAISWFGGNMIINGTLLTGEFFSFISYVGQILISLMMLSMIFVTLVISRASLSRIIEIFDELPDILEPENGETNIKDGSIAFKNVNFSYNKGNENLTLSNINLTISSGETVGIIGGTGSSKTTLVQLIPRLYDTTSGSVMVGGKNVKEYKLEDLRDAVSMVLQKNVLFSGTIKDNLKWGNPNASDKEIEGAAKAACAHDFIMSFSKGYETDLGQGGVNVSGGQKQRLCIARALLKKPKIIILDDSTSAVDTATDSAIRRAFKENLKGTTTIIIAQRIASVRDADKIIVLNNGQIDAIGTHDELIKTNDIYREVYESQQKGAA